MRNSNKKPMHHKASALIFDRARQLKENETPTEKKLWKYVKGKQLGGAKFRRQHPIGRYIVDFYCHAAKLVIEIDGGYHLDKLQQRTDEDRTRNLEELELRVIRFTNEEIEEQIEQVLEIITKELKFKK